jgi:hypothetical protein
MEETTKVPVVDGEQYDIDVAGEDDSQVHERKGTSADRQAMWRMGKVQEMRVRHNRLLA